jgi:hypothetical protein
MKSYLELGEKITRFVLSKVDQELNKLQELSVNCQQQQNINSPNGNNNQLGDDRSYHNAPPYYHEIVLCLEDVFELLVLCAISTRCCWIRLLGCTLLDGIMFKVCLSLLLAFG